MKLMKQRHMQGGVIEKDSSENLILRFLTENGEVARFSLDDWGSLRFVGIEDRNKYNGRGIVLISEKPLSEKVEWEIGDYTILTIASGTTELQGYAPFEVE